MKRIFRLAFVIIPICIQVMQNLLSAQTVTDDKIASLLNEYCLNVPYEEIYAHTDRDCYVAGEDLWFGIFNIDRQTGKLTEGNSIAYCELLNPYNSPVIRKRLRLESGHGGGYMLLPDTLSTGEYTLRIYTNVMKNFMPGNCFMKVISVYNGSEGIRFKKRFIFEKPGEKDLNIEFFPEGGTILSEVPLKVAVKVTDRWQQGIGFYGILRNNLGDSVTYLRTDDSGITSFEFKPQKDLRYYVESDGSLYYLSAVSEEGFAMKTDNSAKDRVSVDVYIKENTPGKINRMLFLFIHTRGIKNYSEFFRVIGDSVRLTVPRSALMPGINHITLFSAEGKPLCNRYIFTRGEDNPEINLPGNYSYGRREKVVLETGLPGIFKGNSSEAVAGVSVSLQTPGFTSRDMGDYNIIGTEFGMLPSLFAGKNIRDIEETAVDNYLITAQSTWLSWDRILPGKIPLLKYLPEREGHYLTGLVRKRDAGEAVPGKLLYLSVPGKTAAFQYAVTDGSGQFRFMLPDGSERNDLIIQPPLPDEENTIQIGSPWSEIFFESRAFADSTFREFPDFVGKISTAYQINKIYNIVYRTGTAETAFRQYPSYRFYGKPEVEIFLKDFIRLPAMQEIFFELTPGIRLRSTRAGYEVRVNNPADNTIYDDPPLVLIDGVVVTDLSILANLDPEIVEKIEAVRTPYITGSLIHYGIVNVITAKGNFQNITLPDYVARFPYSGTDLFPSFTSPYYADDASGKSRIPDFRSTLLWAPVLKPDDRGKIRIEFTTPDRPGNYVINMQGMTADGKFISGRKIITVN